MGHLVLSSRTFVIKHLGVITENINGLPWLLFLYFSQMNPQMGRKHFSFNHKNVTIFPEYVHLFPPPWRGHIHFQHLKKRFFREGQFGKGGWRVGTEYVWREETKQKCSESKRCLLITAFNSFILKSLGKTENWISKHLRDQTGLHSKWKHHISFTFFFFWSPFFFCVWKPFSP